MSTIQCEIVSAEESIYSGVIDLLVAAGTEGDLGVSKGHAQLLSGLKPGPITVTTGDSTEIVYISGGFIEVQPDVVTILADTAIRAHDLDEAAVLEAQAEAEKAMSDQAGEMDYSRAAAELAAAVAQLRTIQQIKNKLGK